MYLMVLGLFKIVFFQMTSFSKFFARCQYFINTSITASKIPNRDFESSRKQPYVADAAMKIVDGSLRREEVEYVMERLGLFCHPGDDLLQERVGSVDISNLFEEKESCLEDEVKGAFYVFDENRDGFIDASDLQRVLCALGLKEQSKIEDCRRMIRLHDENGDGKIDFEEFVKFMEKSF